MDRKSWSGRARIGSTRIRPTCSAMSTRWGSVEARAATRADRDVVISGYDRPAVRSEGIPDPSPKRVFLHRIHRRERVHVPGPGFPLREPPERAGRLRDWLGAI